MSEIEKMYKNAGLNNLWVERYSVDRNTEIKCWHKSYKEMIKAMMKKNDWNREEAINVAKKECKKELPPFTAKKQLELLKLFGTKYESSDITTNSKEADIWSLYFNIFRKTKEGFDEALAGLFNFIWQDLTDTEKAEIKRILED